MPAHEIHSKIVIDYLMRIDLFNSDGIKDGAQLVVDLGGLESVEMIATSTDQSGDGTFDVVMRHGDTDVYTEHLPVDPDGEILGPPALITTGNQLFKQGYAGKKRFLSAEIVAVGVTNGRRLGAILIANSPRHAPTPE